MKTAAQHRILIVDDHPIVRHGMRQLLNRENDLLCDVEAHDAESALAALRDHKVDLAIVDISLPGVSGLEVVRRLRMRDPELPILILSMHEEASYADRALAAGARGYVMKHEATDKLVDAVRKLLAGGVYVSARVETRMLDSYVRSATAEQEDLLKTLSPREFEVLRMIAQGLTSAQIAARVNRSQKSVENYRTSIRTKLRTRKAADLSHIALQYFPMYKSADE